MLRVLLRRMGEMEVWCSPKGSNARDGGLARSALNVT